MRITLEDKDEAYYMLKGRLTLIWNEKRTDVGEEDAVLFRAGTEYRVTNTGSEPATLVYVICPWLLRIGESLLNHIIYTYLSKKSVL